MRSVHPNFSAKDKLEIVSGGGGGGDSADSTSGAGAIGAHPIVPEVEKGSGDARSLLPRGECLFAPLCSDK